MSFYFYPSEIYKYPSLKKEEQQGIQKKQGNIVPYLFLHDNDCNLIIKELTI